MILFFGEGMNDLIKNKLFSFSSVAISIGVIGVISSFVTLFIDIHTMISIKIPLALVWFFSTVLIVLLKIIFDLTSQIPSISVLYEKPISLYLDKKLIILKKNNIFHYNTIVGCYSLDKNVEFLVCIGFVSHIQENFTQITVMHDCRCAEETARMFNSGCEHIVIRPHIPKEILSNMEL